MYVIEDVDVQYFEFKLKNKKYSVPFINYLPYGEFLKFQEEVSDAFKSKDEIKMLKLITAIFDEYAPGVTDKIVGEQFNELIRAYYQASGIDLGE